MAVIIATALGFVLTAIGAVGAAAFVTSTFGVALVAIGLGVGLTLLGSNVLQAGQSPIQKPSDGQQTIKQPLAARTRSYGRVRVSGVVWWMGADTLTPSTLYLGIAINHGEISNFYGFHIDENSVDLDVNDKVTTSPYSAYNVYLKHRKGLTPETKYGDINTVFGIDETRGDGVASILAEITNPADVTAFTKTYPNNRPLIRATIDATKVWDPRDAAQVRTDTSTHVWSDNAVLCLLHYLLSPDGYGMSYDRFQNNLAQWKAAADICDEQVPLLTVGTGSRYRVAGTYALTDNPKDVVAKFESVCDGRVWQKRDGSIGIAVGKFETPTITLTEDDIVGYEGLMFGQDQIASIAGIRAQYMSPDHDYREHEAEPWPDGGTVLALSEDRTAALDLLWVPSNSQARRIMKRAFIRATADWRGTITTNLGGLRALDERYINITIGEISINRSFEIEKFTFDRTTLTCELQVRSIDASIDNWVATEEGSAEEQVLSISKTFIKTGTTLNPLTEAGAVIGQVVFVFGGTTTTLGLPLVPTGWTRRLTATGAGFDTAIYWRQIDGTEGVATFLNGAGPLTAVVFDGLTNPQFNSQSDFMTIFGVGSAEVPINTLDGAGPGHVVSTPFVIIGHWVIGIDSAALNSPQIEDDAKVAIAERFIVNRTGSITQNVAVVIFGTDSIRGDVYHVSSQDQGANFMLAGLMAEPGV